MGFVDGFKEEGICARKKEWRVIFSILIWVGGWMVMLLLEMGRIGEG